MNSGLGCAQTSPPHPLGLISISETPKHSKPRFIKPHRHHSQTCCDSITAVTPRLRRYTSPSPACTTETCCSIPATSSLSLFLEKQSNHSRQPATVHSDLVAQGLSLSRKKEYTRHTNPIYRRFQQSTRIGSRGRKSPKSQKYIRGEPV
jgi:hypothetical protein